MQLLLLFFSVTITTFIVKLMSAIESKHGKTYPGFSVFEKDGQFARLVGEYRKLFHKTFLSP